MPNTSLREATPTASLRDATRTLLLFLGCANDAATSLLRLRQRRRSVQVSTSAHFLKHICGVGGL
ncbi:MAG: hypothetical protein ACYTXA_26230 [Nostoc sp.]